jgi:hypothetical protein
MRLMACVNRARKPPEHPALPADDVAAALLRRGVGAEASLWYEEGGQRRTGAPGDRDHRLGEGCSVRAHMHIRTSVGAACFAAPHRPPRRATSVGQSAQ